MKRAWVGACIGAVCGVMALAGFGAWGGFMYGGEWSGRIGIPPGWHAAAMGAFVVTAYYWWLAGAVGGFIGGAAGFGSWLVRPRAQAHAPSRQPPPRSVT